MFISTLDTRYSKTLDHADVSMVDELTKDDIKTKKPKDKSQIFNLTNARTRGFLDDVVYKISGFIIDYDHDEMPKMKSTYSYYYHKSHSGHYHIIIPFDADYVYRKEWDTTENFIFVIKNFIDCNILDLFAREILQKECCSFVKRFYYMPDTEDLHYIDNDKEYGLPFLVSSKKSIVSHVKHFNPGKNLENFPKKLPKVFSRCFWFMKIYKFDIDWKPIDTGGQCMFDWHSSEKSGQLFNNPTGKIAANIHCKHATCVEKLNQEFEILYEIVEKLCEKHKIKIPSIYLYNRTMRYLILAITKGDKTGLSLSILESCAFYKNKQVFSNILLFSYLDMCPESDVGVWVKIAYSSLVFNPENQRYYCYKDGCYRNISYDIIKNEMISLCGLYYSYVNHGKRGMSYAKSIAGYILGNSLQDFQKLEQHDHINLLNGIILLNRETPSYTFLPHTKTLFSTEQKNIKYDPDKKPEIWLKSLDQYFSTEKEKLYQDTLQQFFGYCLTYDRSMEKFLLIFGITNSGKSTMSEVIIDMLNAGQSNLKALLDMDNRTTSCENRTVLILEEVEAVKYPSTREFIKKASSRASIMMRLKTKDAYASKRFPKMIFTSNTFPDAFDVDPAFKRRLLLVPLTKSIKAEKVDINRNEKLRSPEEMSGILNWTLEGFITLYKKKTFTSDKELSDEYYMAANPVMFMLKNFLDEYVNDMKEDAKWVRSSFIYKKFTNDYGKELEHPITIVKFGKLMKSLGISKKISQGAHYYLRKKGMYNQQF